ncbi:MAG: MFS transporter [Janthinobacterium lividum]
MSVTKTVSNSLLNTYDKLMNLQKNSFRYWRVRIMYASIIGYAAFYLVRQNFAMAIPGLSEEFHLTKIDIGWIGTWWSIAYGIGKFVNGYVSDRSNARYFMSLGLLGSALTSCGMAYGNSLMFFGGLWIVNAWFQSMGWPPCARLITHWFSPRELGTKWAFWASSHQIGAATIFLFSSYLLTNNYGWRAVFLFPGIIAAVLSIFVFNRLRDTPKELGLPAVEEYKGDVVHLDPRHDERITISEVLSMVIKNKYVWFVGFAQMCLYIPRMGIFFWAPMFLKEVKGVSLAIAGLQLAAFEIAGLLGGISAGWLSDHVFDGRRGPVGAFYMLGCAVAIGVVWLIPAGHEFYETLALMMAGFLVYGPQVMAGIASADLTSKRAAGVATGLTGSFAYVGSAISSLGVGYIVHNVGWAWGFNFFIISAVFGAFFFALTWNKRARVLEQN